jgi:O-antigen/teichoic acid export membrane protein
LAVEFLVLPGGVLLGLMVLLFRTGPPTLQAIVLCFVLSLAASLLVSLALLLLRTAASRASVGESARTVPPLSDGRSMRRELPAYLGITLVNNGLAAGPYLILPFFAGAQATGEFAVAHRLVALTATVNIALTSYFGPKFAESASHGDWKALHVQIRSAQIWSSIVYLPLFVVFVLGGGPLVGLFGPEFVGASGLLLILAAGRLFNAACGPVDACLCLIGAERRELANATFFLLLFFVTGVLAVYFHGVTGLAVAYAICFALRSVVSFSLTRVRMREIPVGT